MLDEMTYTEQCEHEWNIGLPIFKKLFEKNSSEIKTIVAKIFESRKVKCNNFIFSECAVEKVIKNDEPRSIGLYFYDSIEINPFGIYFKPEHRSQIFVVPFDSTFQFPEGV